MLRHFPQQAPNLYGDIYGSIKDEPELVDRWRLLGRDNKKCLLVFFQNARPVEFRVELDRLLADDPELKAFDAAEKLTLFEAWYHNGDKLELIEALREKSDWRAIGWKQLALRLCRVWRLSECLRHGAPIRFDTAGARSSGSPYRGRSRTTGAAASYRHRHRCGALPRAGERRQGRASLGAITSAARSEGLPRLPPKPRSGTLGAQS